MRIVCWLSDRNRNLLYELSVGEMGKAAQANRNSLRENR
ncbi:hypothetical protein NIES2104_01240 [Leptolyngbya sp. NIES-2104]|nr:hypothetical protein NIES2104_01240 [Leptolyngbya sp. NIES-2104]